MVWSSSSVRLAIVKPCIDVKSLMEEYLKFVNHAANFVFLFDSGFLIMICMLFMGVINMLLVNASHPGFNSMTCNGTFS